MKKSKILLAMPLMAMALSGCSFLDKFIPSPDEKNEQSNDNSQNQDGGNNQDQGQNQDDKTPAVKSVSISGVPTNSIFVGSQFTLTVNVEVENGAAQTVTWESSNNTIATVDGGNVTALAVGSATITAKSTVDPTKMDSVTINVVEQSQDTNVELDTFNQIVNDVKTKHNYTLYVHSQFDDETDETQILDAYYYNINDKAWFNTAGTFPYSGVVLQKDQGYLYFDSLGESIIDDGFVSTNTEKGVSEIWDLVGENLFMDAYTQDTTDKTKFVTSGAENNNIATAANFTQYADYISTSQLSVDTEGMSATVDVTNKTIKLTLKWKIWYFDETEHQDPGTITIEVKDVGTTTNKMIEDFIENPTITYTKPTTWPEGSADVFNARFNGLTPVFPNGVSYAFEFGDVLYSGYYYATVTDYASGDLTSSYGTQLENDGFTKKSDTSYSKNITNSGSTMQVTYNVTMAYTEPSVQFPKGIMKIRYRSASTTGVFASIEDFNTYLTNNKYNEIFPLLPEESTCTGISNFKDTTATSESYALKFNSTDWVKVAIPTYAKAVAWRTAFTDAVLAKGFTDTQIGGFLFDSYGYEGSTTGSVICVVGISESTYPGYIQFRASITNEDAEAMRKPAAELTSITLSNMTTTYEVGDTFSFDGICTAHFSDGSSMEVTPTSVSTPLMNSAGTKTVTVSYTSEEITKTATYDITVTAKALPAINVTINAHATLDHIEDEAGNTITTFDSKTNYGFMIYLNIDAGYTVTKVTLEGDDNVMAGYYEGVLYVYPDNMSLSVYNVDITIGEETPAPVTYKLSKSNDSGCQIKMVNPSTSGSSWDVEVGTTVKFWVKPFSGYEVDTVSIENHPEITFSTTEVDGHIEYSFNMPEHDVKIVATSKTATAPVTTYSISVPTITGGSISNIQPGTTNIEAGQQVRFTVKADENYALVANSITVKDANNQDVSFSLAPMSSATYIFTMPASNVTISAEFETTVTPTTYSATKEVNNSSWGTVGFVSSSADLSAGDTVTVSVKPAEGYELDTISIKNHPEIVITKGSTNFAGATQYSFEMPASDVVVVVNFKSKTSGGQTTSINDVLSSTTFAGTCNDASSTSVTFVFNADGTGTASFSSGEGFLAKNYVQSFSYSVGTPNNNKYNITIGNVAKVSGSATGLSMNLSNFSSFEFTYDGTSVTAATYVAYSSIYETTYTTTFSF